MALSVVSWHFESVLIQAILQVPQCYREGTLKKKIASIRNSDAIFSMLRVIKETLSITPPMNLCWLFAMRPATRAAVMTAIIHLPPFIDFSAKIFFLKILSL